MRLVPTALAALFIVTLSACGESAEPAGEAAEGAPAEEFERGPHNGRMLRDGDFAVEITIFEDGVPPEYRVYAYRDDEPLAPETINLSIQLKRLDGEVNTFSFRPQQDFLRGNATVTEPHSFDVTVTAREGGRQHKWQFASYEGRVTIPAEAARAAGIVIERAGPASLAEAIEVVGRVELDPSATAEVGAKFPGRVVAANANVGQFVRAGQVLARVESSESMQVYSITSPISGVVVERTNVGDVAGSDPVYVIADPNRTMAVFPIFPRDMERVRTGQPILLGLLDGERKIASRIANFQPSADPLTGALLARARLPNRDGFWRAGMSVRGVVTVASRQVPLAVNTEALQSFRDFTVVFAQVGNTYEVRMLELGTRGPVWTEVLGGIKPGQAYVAAGSYVIKADIEKSGASHDH
jgi:cobalt-zinc-cadmium efflux system membrane fusion protein